jgi:hypothetical protein
MFLFTTPRPLEQLIKDFEQSAGNFEEFYNGMDSRERILFKGYLHDLRVKAHSPFVRGNDETTSTTLF